MRQGEGSRDVELIECLNPMKGIWRARFDVTETEDGATWTEHDFDHRPTAEELRTLFYGWVDETVRQRIESGMTYDGSTVWLSQENQMNYMAATLANMNITGLLSVKVRLGTPEAPVYKTFRSLLSLLDFYRQVQQHIQSCLAEGWAKKDAFDVEPYLRE